MQLLVEAGTWIELLQPSIEQQTLRASTPAIFQNPIFSPRKEKEKLEFDEGSRWSVNSIG